MDAWQSQSSLDLDASLALFEGELGPGPACLPDADALLADLGSPGGGLGSGGSFAGDAAFALGSAPGCAFATAQR